MDHLVFTYQEMSNRGNTTPDVMYYSRKPFSNYPRQSPLHKHHGVHGQAEGFRILPQDAIEPAGTQIRYETLCRDTYPVFHQKLRMVTFPIFHILKVSVKVFPGYVWRHIHKEEC